ncbi:MAG: hypothetical protein JWO67_1312 [Streptosporangiaceae bacterium]|nr:hypothetical protein [Streptosporangiaceae bacterium]
MGKRKIRSVVVSAVVGSALVTTGCQSAPHNNTVGDEIVMVVSASSNEPRPEFTSRVRQLLRDAAQNGPATDGIDGTGSTAVLDTVDQQATQTFLLTPRRKDGKIEHGLQRDKLLDDNLRAIETAAAAVTSHQAGIDLLEGVNQAVRGLTPATLVVLSNGLSTAGGLDLRQVGWHADPDSIVAQLRKKGLMPRLAGWKVLFTGLGETAGAQAPLTAPARDTVHSYWMAICKAARAASCEFDDTRLAATSPSAVLPSPTVPIEGVVSVTGPRGETTTTLSDAVLGFTANSAELGPAAQDLLQQTAARIKAALDDKPSATITVRGWTANPPGALPADLLALSSARAQAVADALVRYGVTNPITVIGGGAASDPNAMTTGHFDETTAVKMRRSEITF